MPRNSQHSLDKSTSTVEYFTIWWIWPHCIAGCPVIWWIWPRCCIEYCTWLCSCGKKRNKNPRCYNPKHARLWAQPKSQSASCYCNFMIQRVTDKYIMWAKSIVGDYLLRANSSSWNGDHTVVDYLVQLETNRATSTRCQSSIKNGFRLIDVRDGILSRQRKPTTIALRWWANFKGYNKKIGRASCRERV